MKEIWKPIPGYPDYEISNTGNVRSWKKYHSTPTPRPMKKTITHKGYCRVGLIKDGKMRKWATEHKRDCYEKMALKIETKCTCELDELLKEGKDDT